MKKVIIFSFTKLKSRTVESSASYDDTEEKLVVRIQDTGIGIAAANIERIFEPFDQEDNSESRRYSGLGLGLAISREIARKHGGDITVESVQGHGSTFIVTLPYRLASWPDLEDVSAGMSRLTSVQDAVGDSAAQKVLQPMPAERLYTGGQFLGVHTSRQKSKGKQTIEHEDPREEALGVPSPEDPSEVPVLTSEAPSVDAASVLVSTALQMQKYHKEIGVARAQAVELEKRVDDLKQRVAQKHDASEQLQQQAACVKQRVLVQRELCKEQSQLCQRIQYLQKATEMQANLLFSQQIEDVYAFSTVDLKDPRIIEVEDTALEAVKEAEADSKKPLQRLTEFAETLEGPERAQLLRLADSFGESFGLLQAALGQKQYFLQSLQEQIRNPYRDWQDSTSLPRRWLFDLIVSLFTHSMGGGISCKALLEGHLPHHYLAARWDFCWVHTLMYCLTYFSPGDIVFRAMNGRRSPLRLLCVVADSFDAVTTLCGVVAAGYKRFPLNHLLPAMLGAVLFSGGSFFRCLVTQSWAEMPIVAPTAVMARGAIAATLFWWFGLVLHKGKWRSQALMTLTWLWIGLDLLADHLNCDPDDLVAKNITRLHQLCRLQLTPSKPDPKPQRQQ
eukprot:s388_g15.t1